jgi:hypothetical protein
MLNFQRKKFIIMVISLCSLPLLADIPAQIARVKEQAKAALNSYLAKKPDKKEVQYTIDHFTKIAKTGKSPSLDFSNVSRATANNFSSLVGAFPSDDTNKTFREQVKMVIDGLKAYLKMSKN